MTKPTNGTDSDQPGHLPGLSLRWTHMPFSWFCPALAHMILFVLRFYGPVNPMGSCRAWSVYLTTRLLGRLCPLSG